MAKKRNKKIQPITINQYNKGGEITAMGQAVIDTTGALGAFGGMAGGMVDQFSSQDPLKGRSAGSHAASGALKGASMGAALGPWGAAAGAVIGGVGGLFGNKAEDKAMMEAAQTSHTQQFGQINPFAEGGNMGNSYGAYFGKNQGYSDSVDKFNPELNLVEFKNGGTHEESPFGGIPQGVSPDGTPNTVEAGETKFQDYIFSNRLKVKDPEEFGLSKKLKGETFAKASKKLFKEFEERPNDPISKKTWLANIPALMQANEEARTASEEFEFMTGGRMYAKGGKINEGDYELEDLSPEEVEFIQSQGFDIEFDNEREAQRFGYGGLFKR